MFPSRSRNVCACFKAFNSGKLKVRSILPFKGFLRAEVGWRVYKMPEQSRPSASVNALPTPLSFSLVGVVQESGWHPGHLASVHDSDIFLQNDVKQEVLLSPQPSAFLTLVSHV